MRNNFRLLAVILIFGMGPVFSQDLGEQLLPGERAAGVDTTAGVGDSNDNPSVVDKTEEESEPKNAPDFGYGAPIEY